MLLQHSPDAKLIVLCVEKGAGTPQRYFLPRLRGPPPPYKKQAPPPAQGGDIDGDFKRDSRDGGRGRWQCRRSKGSELHRQRRGLLLPWGGEGMAMAML